MPNVDVINLEGKSLGTLELPDEVFGPQQVNEALLWEAVKHYRASQRQGTAATKNRKLVSGAGKKLWKQKGTGRARVGSIRSPLWRHGGTVHGPQPRSYAYAFPRKKLQGALRAAIASKLVDGTLMVVDSLEIKEAKTKLYRAALNTLDATKTVLLVDAASSVSEGLQRGARNLDGVDVMLTSDVHPYDLLRVEKAIFSRPALESLTETLKKSVSKRKSAAAELEEGHGNDKPAKKKTVKKQSKRKSQKEAA
jgi:large subunit ribosomal protein L4